MTRPVKYVSCGRHVEEPSEVRLLLQALGFGLMALASGCLIWWIVWLAFALGPGP